MYPLVGGDAALCEPQPQSRVGVVKLNGFHQTLERSEGSSDVQELNAAVVQQLIALVGLQGAHGHTGQLFTWISKKKNPKCKIFVTTRTLKCRKTFFFLNCTDHICDGI